MATQSETFGRLLRGAINSIAAYEGKSAALIEDELGDLIGLSGAAIQRYKASTLPPEARTVQILAAAVRRGYLGRAWLQRFLQAAQFPAPAEFISRRGSMHSGRAPSLRQHRPDVSCHQERLSLRGEGHSGSQRDCVRDISPPIVNGGHHDSECWPRTLPGHRHGVCTALPH
jgi:hypothetical protein